MHIFTNGKAWIVMAVLPAVALFPDLAFLLTQKVFFPTPTDAVMIKQQKNPHYVYDGFDEVFVPGLPGEEDKKVTSSSPDRRRSSRAPIGHPNEASEEYSEEEKEQSEEDEDAWYD